MPYWSKDTVSAATALSEYETALFKKAVYLDAPEQAQAQAANDGLSLCQLFARIK